MMFIFVLMMTEIVIRQFLSRRCLHLTATYELFKKLEDHFNGNVFTIEDGEAITDSFSSR